MLDIDTRTPKESVMLCMGALTPEHWAFVPLILDILHNPIVLFLISLFLFHIGKDVTCCVTCCVTCYNVTNIPYIASFYCCKNCVDLD